MLEEYSIYFKKIAMPQAAIERVEIVSGYIDKIKSEEIIDVFICDSVNSEGMRSYDSLFLITENYVHEAKQFLLKDNIDSMKIARIKHIDFNSVDYDYEKATNKSRLDIQCTYSFGMSIYMKATGNNCDVLVSIYNKHFKNRIE